MNALKTLPGGSLAAEFFADYWQKKPLLMPAALADFSCPVSAEELAGLACEEDVESTLEIDSEAGCAQESGPFAEQRFLDLPAFGWQLQVRAVNRQVPALALLLDRFSFIPNWQIDRLDALYTPPQSRSSARSITQGLFVLGAQGHLQIEAQLELEAEAQTHLKEQPSAAFAPTQGWRLAHGDLLYLPPGLDYRLATDERDGLAFILHCYTPHLGDLLTAFCRQALAQFDLDARYAEDESTGQGSPGELAPSARAAVRDLVRALALDDEAIDRGYGAFITGLRDDEFLPEPEEALRPKKFRELFKKHKTLWRSEYARYAQLTDARGNALLFVAGETFELVGEGAKLARLLASRRLFHHRELAPCLDDKALLETLTDLYNRGALYFPEG